MGGRFSKTVLAASVDRAFRVLLNLIMMDNDVLYFLTVRENFIIRYVEVMPRLHLFSMRFMRILVHFQL